MRLVCLAALTAVALAVALPAAAELDDGNGPEGPTAEEQAAAPSFPEPSFGPQYFIEDIVVRGNTRTEAPLILAQLGLRIGDRVAGSDTRVEIARLRLLSLGYFLDARLSLQRGSKRGGAILLVEVEERGTLVINELYPSTSRATQFWGGADVSETNFLGRGVTVGGGFVASTQPVVAGADNALGLRMHAAVPQLHGPGVSLSVLGLYNDGNEFYRAVGPDGDQDPRSFTALRIRRGGGVLGVARSLSRDVRVSAAFREEAVSASFPVTRTRVTTDGELVPIDFGVREGFSLVTSVALAAERDTRSDPVLPRSGSRVSLSVELSHGVLSSDYSFGKVVALASRYVRMPRGHVLGFHGLAGAVFGAAPYFDRFFVGDLNLFLPRRALGMNFSTLPSYNLLGTSIAGRRYDSYAARLLVEYAIPLWRRRGFVYRGDAFAAFGIFGLANADDFRGDDRSLPIDLTGDLGVRLDTYLGIFTISVANALSRSSF